jgi:hypothetical protein
MWLAYFQLKPLEAPAMQLTDFVRGVPNDVWALFEPILPSSGRQRPQADR